MVLTKNISEIVQIIAFVYIYRGLIVYKGTFILFAGLCLIILKDQV